MDCCVVVLHLEDSKYQKAPVELLITFDGSTFVSDVADYFYHLQAYLDQGYRVVNAIVITTDEDEKDKKKEEESWE